MNKQIIITKDYWLIVLITILYFFTNKAVIPTLFFFITALVVGFYFFPLKIFLFNSEADKKLYKFIPIVQHIIVGAVIIISSLILFRPGIGDLKVYFNVLALLNLILVVYLYMKEDISSCFLRSMCLIFLSSAVIAV